MSDNEKIDYGQAIVDALKRTSVDSSDRNERYELIFSIERSKWPHDMDKKTRSEIPEELQDELDECITKSSLVAREACQSVELTEKYLKLNNYER